MIRERFVIRSILRMMNFDLMLCRLLPGSVRRSEVVRQGGTGVDDGLFVRVEISLGRGQLAVAGDQAEALDLYAGVGHPGQAGVAEVVPA